MGNARNRAQADCAPRSIGAGAFAPADEQSPKRLKAKESHMLRSILPAVGALTFCGAAFAQPALEIEPNGFPPGTIPVPPGLPHFAVLGAIAPGDVDYHECGPVFPFPTIFPVPGGFISASTWTSPGIPPLTEDTYLGAFLPAAVPPFVSVDDDDNPAFNSAHHFTVPFGPPPLSHVVTGFGDPGFVGAHAITTPYCLVVSHFGLPEVEPNDVIPAANPLPPLTFGTTAMEGMLLPTPIGGDVDMYSMGVAAGAWVTFAVYDFSPVGAPAMDTFIGVFDPAGFLIDVDDDDGPALLSALSFLAPAAGVYTFAVTGFPDAGFAGAHGVVGPYRAVIAECAAPVGCNSIDLNKDGLYPDTLDIDDFLSVFSGGPCSNDPFCNDVDFNNDGLFPDTLDIDSLLSVFSGGPCL
jgi:hypothetical protein